MLPQFSTLVNEFLFFNENFINKPNYFLYNNYSFFLYLNDYSSYFFLDIFSDSSKIDASLEFFLKNLNYLDKDLVTENMNTIYHYSIPNTKLAYPEPFIASPSFMHSDLWFVHILVYQYWLWFVFVFIIVFFFTTFLCTVRWCNMRTRPRRETRGVSRSKCGDLITACVPVTWATSIIVNESTDAIDYYDGFGTTELVVGIRAYQWGWEYYYPKDIDLNYNIKNSYSTFVGNSLKYDRTSSVNLKANNLWKYYQNKNFDQVITPAHFLVIPLDNFKLLNFLNFNDIGSSPVNESNAFKKVRMFSKTSINTLQFTPTLFTYKYKNLSNLFINENFLYESYLYGLKRQHNFMSLKANFNNQSTFLDLNSSAKLVVSNFNYLQNFNLKINQVNNLSNFKKINSTISSNTLLNFNSILTQHLQISNLKQLLNFLNFNNFISLLNDNSDKKFFNYPHLKLFNLKFKKNLMKLQDNLIFNNINNLTDLNIFPNNNELVNWSNETNTYKSGTVFSSNQSISLTNRFLRNFLHINANRTNWNYSTLGNQLNAELFNSNSSTGLGISNLFVFLKNNWTNKSVVSRLIPVKVNFDVPHSPVLSNSAYVNAVDFDNLNNSFSEETPSVLQGKEELMPNFLPTIYWNFFFNNSTIEWRLYNSSNYRILHNLNYLPIFTFYYDYDFRNWQSIELLEDSFWESSGSLYNVDDYVNLKDEFYDYNFFDKFTNYFNVHNRIFRYKDKIAQNSLAAGISDNEEFYTGVFYLDDFYSNTTLLASKDFFSFPIISAPFLTDDSYENFKYLNYIASLVNKNFINNNQLNLNYHSSLFTFDFFRSDYDEFSWFSDETILTDLFNNLNSLNSILSNDLNILNDTSINVSEFANDSKSLRFTNYLNLRAPTKSAIVTYNAIQKVFRTRFDENRSNTKLNDFAYFFNKQPFISSSRIQYEKSLGKTHTNFHNINLYKTTYRKFFNFYYSFNSSLNFYFFDFPFLMAMKSDASRYLWFDWFAKWGFYEVQPSSSSRYAIYGMPYFSKNFDFSASNSEVLNESETYLLRLSRARKNYLPNWTYVPYFYAKHTSWYRENLFFNIFQTTDNSLDGLLLLLNSMKWYWNDRFAINYNISYFLPSNSGINSYAKLGWKPQSSIQAYYYSISNLIDILTKREYLFRELFSLNNKIISIPNFLTNSPSNELLNEIKSSFLFIDPTHYLNEYSRDVYYDSLKFFNFTIIKSFLSEYFNFLSISNTIDLFFFYFFEKTLTTNNSNNDLLKSQYRPLRKGITNMIRLHATGAVAMPVEIRLQVLASSKDVIHSWAIPSAGIKIDCVPGYSSHKVMIFLVSGIFWGQCMEICGRYHHWMPIVIYFMKRDLFFLWCTHFVFLTNNNSSWSINDRSYTNYARFASFDKYSWINEIVK